MILSDVHACRQLAESSLSFLSTLISRAVADQKLQSGYFHAGCTTPGNPASSVEFLVCNQVMNNGLISFTRDIQDYTPKNFSELDSSYVLVAPYWADVDTKIPGSSGAVYYRQMTTATCRRTGDAGRLHSVSQAIELSARILLPERNICAVLSRN
jgi:hypothetical protein